MDLNDVMIVAKKKLSIGDLTYVNCVSPLTLSCSNFLIAYVTHRIHHKKYSLWVKRLKFVSCLSL